MGFKKDGEIKVFVDNDSEDIKTAKEKTKERYTIDRLVIDSESKDDEKKEKSDVSN